MGAITGSQMGNPVDPVWSPQGGGAPAVRYARNEDGVAVVELSRPDRRNALSNEVREGLWYAFSTFEEDGEAQVMLLCAQGRHFCAGGDLEEMASSGLGEPPPDFLPIPGQNIDVQKPIVAAVQGAALGGGFLLAQSADLVVAAEGASFGITEARWGRGAPWAWPLPGMIGSRQALELLLTARPVDADRAQQMGFVNEVVALPQLRTAALALTATIAGNAPLSVRAGKSLVADVKGLTPDQATALGSRLFADAYASDDAIEGPRAFRDGRQPLWSGHRAAPLRDLHKNEDS